MMPFTVALGDTAGLCAVLHRTDPSDPCRLPQILARSGFSERHPTFWREEPQDHLCVLLQPWSQPFVPGAPGPFWE